MKKPLGPPPLPLVGNLPLFLSDKLGFLLRSAASYGEVVALRLAEPTFLLNNPQDIKHVLVANAANYVKSPRLTSPKGKRLSGFGLLTLGGDAHLRQRRMMQPVFHRRTVESFSRVISAGIQRVIAGWTDGMEVDIGQASTGLAQRNIVRIVLGADAEHEMDALLEAISVRRLYMEHVFFSPFPEWMPTRIGWRYRTAMGRITDVVSRAILARRAQPGGREDLLAQLLEATYEDGTGMTDDQARDEAVTLFITGYETVAEALTWTYYLLARHPAVEARLVAEVDGALAGRPPEASDLPRLAYVSMVLSESMRLYPPTWIFIRIAQADDRLPSGHLIREGSKIYLSPYVTHRQAQHFPDPERFDPERFAEVAKKGRAPLAYFPFGSGARVCIGEHLARMEAVLTLAAIAQRFTLSLVSDAPITPLPRMTLRPSRSVVMRLRERKQSGDVRG